MAGNWSDIERSTNPWWRGQVSTLTITGEELRNSRESYGAFQRAVQEEMERIARDSRSLWFREEAEWMMDPYPFGFIPKVIITEEEGEG